MTQLHILTVGISLLTNFAKASNLPLEKVLRLHKQLAGFLKADPRAACSEINSLDAYTGFLRKKNKGLAVTLVYGLGCDLGFPVYYLHETYRVSITLPVCAVPF